MQTHTCPRALRRLLLACLLCCSGFVAAQSRSVSGTITDATNGDPLIGVTVLEDGTTSGTVTDVDGSYSISVSGPEAILNFSYVGYLRRQEVVAGRTVIDLELAPDNVALDEVVVVGYGKVRKSDLTGSVAQVSSEELSALPVASATEALQGRAAGVQVQSSNGAPGATPIVRIRGGTSINASSDPLYVVDGFVGGILPPPQEIASVEILKDASATAIYGSRGANGVVLVTTQRGRTGQARVTLNASYSFQEEINRLDLLDADQYANLIQEIDPAYQQGPANVDWQDEIFRGGSVGNYQLGVSGGSEQLDYFVSATAFDQQGVIINSDFQRYSLRSNLNFRLNDRIDLGVNLYGQKTSSKGVISQENSGGASNTGVVTGAYFFEPDYGLRDDNGNFTISRTGDPFNNPVATATERINENVGDATQANLIGNWRIFDGLTATVSGGAASTNYRGGNYLPTTLLAADQGRGGVGRINAGRNLNLLNENYLTYERPIGAEGNINVVAGYSYQKERFESFGAESQSFVTDAAGFYNLGGGANPQQPNSNLTETELVSWYGRLNYRLNERYLITFNARYDGSSTFSANNKYAFFPSAAVAWNLGREAFLENAEWLDSWKVRASYGSTGNRAIGAYQTLASFSTIAAIQNGQLVNAIRPTSVANNDLTWETTNQLNIGTDIDLLEGRLSLSFDYYDMQTEDLLFRVPLPEYSGFSSQLRNLGSTSNKGIEGSVTLRNDFGEFSWDLNLNASANRNEVVSLPDGLDVLYSSAPGHLVGIGNTQVLREGQPVGSFLGFRYEGVYQEGDDFLPGSGFEQQAGGERFADVNGDGMLNNLDLDIIGDPNPDFIWGFNNTLGYRGFDLNIFIQGSVGNDILSYTLLELGLLSGRTNTTVESLNRWTPTNTNTDVPAANGARSQKISSRYVYDGGYTRLKNLALGYTLPGNVLSALRISSLRVSLSAQNLITITDYPGVDPETAYRSGGSVNSNRNIGIDYGSYPNVKSFTLGLNVGF